MPTVTQRLATAARLQRARLEMAVLLAGRRELANPERARLLGGMSEVLRLECRLHDPDFTPKEHQELIQACHNFLNAVQHHRLRQHILRLPSASPSS